MKPAGTTTSAGINEH